jgi:fibronectin-binding autotransporter adhesin
MDTAGKAKPNNAAGNTKQTSSSFITLNRKGNTMSHTTTFRRGMSALVALVLLIGLATGQNLVIKNGTTINGTGTINVKGSITTPALTVDKTIGGTVAMTGTGAQTIGTAATNQVLTFSTLNVNTASNTTTQEVTGVVVSEALSVANTSAFDIQGKTLTIAKTSALVGTGSLDVTDATSVVNYTRGDGVAQTVLGLNYGGTLNLSGATSGKSFAATGSAVNMTHAGGDLTVNQTWTIGNSGTFGTIADITGSLSFDAGATGTKTITAITNISSGTLATSATSGALAITTLTSNAGNINSIGAGGVTMTTATNGSGSITASGGDVTIATLSGNAGTIQTTGAGLLAFSGTSANAGTIQTTGAGTITFTGAATNTGAIQGSAASTGTITFNSTLGQTSGDVIAGQGTIAFNGVVTNDAASTVQGVGAFASLLDFNANVDNNGTIQLGAQGAATFAASFVNSGTLTLNVASDWTYDGGVDQDIAGGATVTYGNLLTLGAFTKTALGDITVAGNFDNGGVANNATVTNLEAFDLDVTGTSDNENATLRFGGLANGLAFGTTGVAAGTVIYDAATGDAATQTIAAGSYYNLQFENDAPKNMTTNTTVATGTGVSLAAGVTVNIPQTVGTTTMNIGLTGSGVGSLTLAATSTLVNDGTLNVADDIDVDGTLTNNGTATAGW